MYGLRKLPWLRNCSSPVLLLIAKGKLVSNHSMKLNRKILQPHLFCGVLYAYIRSDFWWCNWIWLYSSELYIIFRLWRDCRIAHIWALCYVSTSRLTILPAVGQNWYLLDEHSSWCMLFLDLKLNITINTPLQRWSLLISDMKPTINSLALVECGCLPKVILFYTCSKFCNYTLSVVYSMDIFVLHCMDLRFAHYLSLMLCV